MLIIVILTRVGVHVSHENVLTSTHSRAEGKRNPSESDEHRPNQCK